MKQQRHRYGVERRFSFDANMKDISELRIIRTWRFDPAEAEFEVH